MSNSMLDGMITEALLIAASGQNRLHEFPVRPENAAIDYTQDLTDLLRAPCPQTTFTISRVPLL
jgi:hypothetical protein